MTVRVGVVRFPGTTAETEVVEALWAVGGEPVPLWHTETDLGDVVAVVLPGGAAHGDALRPGAVAARSPIMASIAAFAADGHPVLGVGNGFQILCEAGLLPGAFLPNRDGRFLSDVVDVRVGTDASPITDRIEAGTVLRLPIAHAHGAYHVDADELDELRSEDRIVLRYTTDPNGSVDAVAGVLDATRNVVGVMVRPERAIEPLLGSDDGIGLFSSLLETASVAFRP